MMRWVSIVVLCLLLAGCKQERLLQGLDQVQANQVVAALHRHNIAASKKDNGKSGFSIDVGKTDFSAAADILQAYDLPAKKKMQIADMFPTDSLVASPRAEKARLYSGIEQRLEQSLYAFAGVISARVHVSYDLDAGEGGRKIAPVHVSALATYEGEIDSAALISDIKRFLKNSFADVEYGNISVILSKRSVLQHEMPRFVDKAESNVWFTLLLAPALAIAGVIWMWRRYGQKIRIRKDAAGGDAVV